MELMPHQVEAITKLGNGKILYGGVGSGKSYTAMGYYKEKEYPKPFYVITTAKKRDSLDWTAEGWLFGIEHITVDSWNNIGKYASVEDAFFVFDEQRLVGTGAWVKHFQKIARKNNWILLSGTPGDTWMDYVPVFIANGFYKNATDFKLKHVVYEPFNRYPKIRMYLNETKLELLRNEILVEMPFIKHTQRYLNWIDVDYNKAAFRRVFIERWNIYKDEPIRDAAEMFRILRRVVNSDPSRLDMIKKLMMCHDRLIIFYNFDYELEILRTLSDVVKVGEWNGHRKNPVPSTKSWVYLVQYVAGAEGWNCIDTNAVVFYSMTYSYKNFEQSQGRIDRLNTLFTELFYYIFVSNSVTDFAIRKSLEKKENFNEKKFKFDAKKILFDDENWAFETEYRDAENTAHIECDCGT